MGEMGCGERRLGGGNRRRRKRWRKERSKCDTERERKGFTVRETNVRGEGRCGREKIGDGKKKRAAVSEGAEQRVRQR